MEEREIARIESEARDTLHRGTLQDERVALDLLALVAEVRRLREDKEEDSERIKHMRIAMKKMGKRLNLCLKILNKPCELTTETENLEDTATSK